MGKHIIYLLLRTLTVGLFVNAICFANDFFAKDPEAVYEKSGNMELIIEIPGYKLDPQNALKISIEKKEYEYARHIHPNILDKAKKYIQYTRRNTEDYVLYAAKDLGNYILLYFNEPKVADGGFEIIYSKKLEKIIGFFSAGYKG